MDITLGDIEVQSEDDEELTGLRKALKYGKWPRELRRYEAQKNTLHCLGSLIFNGDKIILPSSLRMEALVSAHAGHIGEVAMKRIMREFFWWPGMATETEKFVKQCLTCCQLARKNPPVPLSSRELPEAPWEVIQIDFLEIPGCGSGEFLVVVDIYSRFLSVVEMRRTNAECTNAALCEVFKRWGVPRIIQSDNGPPFQGSSFCAFWEEKGVKVRKAVPLSPQSNGAVERQNQGIVKAVAASKIDGSNWRIALEKYIHHHNTLVPHARLNVTPFELMVGWKFRGTFPSLWGRQSNQDLDRIDVREKDAEEKLISKQYADKTRGAKPSDIEVGDVVLLSQQKKAKTDPTFSSERYTVVARQGAKVVIVSQNGIQYARNIQDVKRACIEMESEEPLASNALPDSSVPISSGNRPSDCVPGPSSIGPHVPSKTNLRARSNLKKPARYN